MKNVGTKCGRRCFMDIVISFFRDTLDGPFYIAWVVVLVILIFACIGYLAEKGINNKHEREKYATVLENDSDVSIVQDAVITEPIQNEISQVSLSDATLGSNNINTNTEVNSSTNTSFPNNEVEIIPDVVTTPVQSVADVVKEEEVKNSIPVQEANNVVIPSINQDGNNTI